MTYTTIKVLDLFNKIKNQEITFDFRLMNDHREQDVERSMILNCLLCGGPIEIVHLLSLKPNIAKVVKNHLAAAAIYGFILNDTPLLDGTLFKFLSPEKQREFLNTYIPISITNR